MKTTTFDTKVLIGTRDNIKVYLNHPSWECDWYWSFGVFVTRDSWEHVSSIEGNRNLADALREDFELEPTIEKNIWVFCELVKTARALIDAAEVLGRGGVHYTTNPCKTNIINHPEVRRINDQVLPEIFDKLYEIITH
jgi:hypothetical protein